MIQPSHFGVYIQKSEAESLRDICTRMFIAALLTIAKRWKQPRCPSTETWTNKLWSIHTVEYYAALQKKATLLHTTT